MHGILGINSTPSRTNFFLCQVTKSIPSHLELILTTAKLNHARQFNEDNIVKKLVSNSQIAHLKQDRKNSPSRKFVPSIILKSYETNTNYTPNLHLTIPLKNFFFFWKKTHPKLYEICEKRSLTSMGTYFGAYF